MVNLEKSQPAPACLEAEKLKENGDYKCGEVLTRLHADFFNKCYICENHGPTAINVEHFLPHKGNRDLKFDWNNLFYSCGHCNNTKLGNYENILNCTKASDAIESKLRQRFISFPKESVAIEALDNDPKTLQTKELIEAVFNGTTQLKKLESSNLRAKLLREMGDFQTLIQKYEGDGLSTEDQKFYRDKIVGHLHLSSPFTAFKRSFIRSNEVLLHEFGQYC